MLSSGLDPPSAKCAPVLRTVGGMSSATAGLREGCAMAKLHSNVVGIASILVIAGCGTSGGTSFDQDELWAILHDEELTNVPNPVVGLEKLSAVAPAAFQGTFGQWSFDDCNDARTNLADSGPNFNTAFRSVGVTCAPGISGQAVAL